MATELHFIDVGQGNMTLILLDDGTTMLYDCNVTTENKDHVLSYVADCIGWGSNIDIFVNSHRDADHMRGINRVHEYFPIQKVWDSGVTGNNTTTPEYINYMGLRRRVTYKTINRLKRWEFGKTLLRVMNSNNDDLPNDPNAQSIVIKVQHRNAQGGHLSSALLTSDTDACTWRDSIQKHYKNEDLKTDILLAGHHGSITFFDDPKDTQHYYVGHISAMSPSLAIISVGNNSHGHPHPEATDLYEKYVTGTSDGTKVMRTDMHDTIKVVLDDNGNSTYCGNLLPSSTMRLPA